MAQAPQWRMLYESEAFPAASGTKIYPIDKSDQICELLLRVRGTNGATRNFADNATFQDIVEAMTEIKVMNGSNVLKYYNGEMCALVGTYNDGHYPREIATTVGGAIQEMNFPVMFGCFHGDRQVCLPAPIQNFGSLNLTLKWDFTASATAGFAATGFDFDLMALVIPPEADDVMRAKQVVITEKKHDYTTVATGIEPFSMTVDAKRQLRRIFFHCYETGIVEGVDITALKLEANGVEKYYMPWRDGQWANAQDCGLNFERKVEVVGAASDVWRTRIPNVDPVYTSYTAAGADYISAIPTGDQITWPAVAISGNIILKSNVIPGMVVIDRDIANDQSTLLPQNLTSLTVKATNGAAGGTVQVLEESLTKFW